MELVVVLVAIVLVLKRKNNDSKICILAKLILHLIHRKANT